MLVTLFGILFLVMALAPTALWWWDPIMNAIAGRFGEPSKPVSLVLDLLMDEKGWNDKYPRCLSHATGATVEWDYNGHTEKVKIGGQPLPLKRADKVLVKRARLRLEDNATDMARNAAVRQFADNARTYWEQREQEAAQVVPFKRQG